MVWKPLERRAPVARLSLCLGLLAIAFAAFNTSARAAAPVSPKLLSTNPPSTEASPATSTTPLVLGEAEPEDGIIISGHPFRVSAWGVATAAAKSPTQHPEYEIVFFAQPNCAGAQVGRGLAGAFEESGIAVSVPADAVTVLSAAQVDPAEPSKFSACSPPLSYWEGNIPSSSGGSGGGTESGGTGGSGQIGGSTGGGSAAGSGGTIGPAVTTGKPDAPRLQLSPAAVANNNSPVVTGSAPGAGSVLLYANGTCSGKLIAKGSASDLTAGFTIQVADNTTTTFSAVGVGGKRSDCSGPVTYVEDSTAPITRVTMGPGVKTRKHKVALRFADLTEGSPGTSSFLCKVDKAKWKPCASPFRLKHLRLSKYVVRIRAVDLAGNAEKLGAKRIFRVVPAS